ncbi:response regulator [Tranquillimonas alkanivorans]|uniref:Two-component system, chemotaxis family, response regulator CheY n=1 Tax=Tranquillimonas alkanivorans TaxID=441119 RepID=A0A1I5SAI4_9RHOB|nr:response regulator [Tranquillimonas alkanivorans]SFP67798.1 two-component system, chemotaxis family, response regulator CheY [Tranquillimonas alkanivorans]
MSLKDSLRLMVVDDMSTSRGLITQALDWIGIRHYETCNEGATALRTLAANPVHLVISDYNMPGMDGLALLEGLRSNKSTQRIGFILVSGRMDAAMVQKGKKLAMNNYIEKPFTPETMKACIERVTGPL